jgi:hypothetical protein
MKQNLIQRTLKMQNKKDELRPWRNNGKDNNDCIKPQLD